MCLSETEGSQAQLTCRKSGRQRPAERLRQGKGERGMGKGKAARWRANTFDYSRQGGSRSQPGKSLSGSQAIERGSKPIGAVLSWKPGNQIGTVNSLSCPNLVCFD